MCSDCDANGLTNHGLMMYDCMYLGSHIKGSGNVCKRNITGVNTSYYSLHVIVAMLPQCHGPIIGPAELLPIST